MSFILLGILNSQVPPSGAGNSYDLLETTILGSVTASVTFSNLNTYSDYKHLEVRVTAKSNDTNNQALRVVLNADNASNYNWHRLEGDASLVTSTAQANDARMVAGLIARSTGSGEFSNHIISVLDFSNSSKNKTIRTLSGFFQTADKRIQLSSGARRNTAAITSLRLEAFASFQTGSRFSLYGIK
jgi:hypothetical protein